jgi:hypothetical protein
MNSKSTNHQTVEWRSSLCRVGQKHPFAFHPSKTSQNRGMTPDVPPGIGKNATLESWESGDQLLQLNFQGWSREDFSNHDVLTVKN